LCNLDSSLSIAAAFEEFVTKKKELVSHLYYTALDVLKQDKPSAVRLVGLKASVDAALNQLKIEGNVLPTSIEICSSPDFALTTFFALQSPTLAAASRRASAQASKSRAKSLAQASTSRIGSLCFSNVVATFLSLSSTSRSVSSLRR
jgi:hypothetical protein